MFVARVELQFTSVDFEAASEHIYSNSFDFGAEMSLLTFSYIFFFGTLQALKLIFFLFYLKYFFFPSHHPY